MMKMSRDGRFFGIFHVNIQGLTGKVSALLTYLEDKHLDFVCLSEHFICDENILKSINLNQYELAASYCRKSTMHGGVAIFAKRQLDCVPLDF